MIVKLKSSKELIKLGYEITHLSDDGMWMRFKKVGGGMEV